jgi:Flp pilus assembly protein CpaB
LAEKSKSVKLLAAAIGFGLLAALLAVFYLKAREAALRARLTPDDQKIQVVVANRDLAKGTVIESDPAKFAIRTIPRDFVHNDAITPADLPQVEGKKLVENLAAGKALLRSFIDDDFPRDFSDTIPLKRRAMTVQVDEVNSINGFIRPGNRIDLLVSLPAGAAGSESSSDSVMPVLENVEVLATGRDSAYEYEEKMMLIQGGVMHAPASNFTAITINVTPQEAALVETAQEKGDLLALLRNRKDTSGFGFTEVVPGDLMSNADKLASEAAVRESVSSVEKQGLVVGKDGKIRTKDGVELKDQNLVVGADGTIRTKDGVVLSGRGLTINEKGELVTADGTVVDSANLVVAADGTVMTKDGKVLSGEKHVTQAIGETLPSGGLQVAADGTVTDKSGKVVAGITVDKDGNVIKDGKVLEGVKLDANGNMVDAATGKPVVVTESGAVLKGVTTNEKGEIVMADGTVVDPANLMVSADGTVTTKDGKKLAGVSANVSATQLAQAAAPGGGPAGTAGAQPIGGRYDFLAGGVSKDGVATVNSVPVAD